MAKIIVTIENGGKTSIRVEGVAGVGCKALTADLEKELGGVLLDIPTYEAFQAAAVQQKAKALR